MDSFDRKILEGCLKDEEAYRARLDRQREEVYQDYRQGIVYGVSSGKARAPRTSLPDEVDAVKSWEFDSVRDYFSRLKELTQRGSLALGEKALEEALSYLPLYPDEDGRDVFAMMDSVWQRAPYAGHAGVARYLGQVGENLEQQPTPSRAAAALLRLTPMVTEGRGHLSRLVLGNAASSIAYIGLSFPEAHGSACLGLLEAAMEIDAPRVQTVALQWVMAIGYIHGFLKDRAVAVFDAVAPRCKGPVRAMALEGAAVLRSGEEVVPMPRDPA